MRRASSHVPIPTSIRDASSGSSLDGAREDRQVEDLGRKGRIREEEAQSAPDRHGEAASRPASPVSPFE